MISESDFLTKYNITVEKYSSTGLLWDDLRAIYNDYVEFKEELEPSAIYMFNSIMKSSNVHSVRYRIKNPEHLIEKIIRKKIENDESNITLENYKEEVNDLIGLRALHLFKEGWEPINDFIRKSWNLKQTPVANFRKGDSDKIIDFFKTKGCDIKEHKYGYRSIHYIIETQPGRTKFYAEIQVRTIFEEAWAEIDHTIRYPYDLENPIFFQFLLILNRLAGSADEMGSFIQFLKGELISKESEFKQQIDEKAQVITNLEAKIEKLNLKEEELESVKADLAKLKSQKTSFLLSDKINISGLPLILGASFPFDNPLARIGDTLMQYQRASDIYTKTLADFNKNIPLMNSGTKTNPLNQNLNTQKEGED